MLELELPTRHEWITPDNTYGKLVIEPFEPGFALTVGNAYRRVLLSSIHGAAPTWVKIENVLHEFSHMQGIMEDTLDILMHLRKVVFRCTSTGPRSSGSRPRASGVVKAGDFEADADVEILTPDVPLATLDKDGVLEMEVCVERGRGWVPAERREPEALPINAILLDADFSAVKRVNFHMEPASGGRERLVLEVWTDGSMSPEVAVGEASRILEDHFDLLMDFPVVTPRARGDQRDETAAAPGAEREPVPQRGRAGAVGARLELSQDRQHPDHRRPGPEERGRAAQDQELRQEVPQRDQDDPRRDGAAPRHAARPRGAGAAARAVRAHLRNLARPGRYPRLRLPRPPALRRPSVCRGVSPGGPSDRGDALPGRESPAGPFCRPAFRGVVGGALTAMPQSRDGDGGEGGPAASTTVSECRPLVTALRIEGEALDGAVSPARDLERRPVGLDDDRAVPVGAVYPRAGGLKPREASPRAGWRKGLRASDRDHGEGAGGLASRKGSVLE